MGPKIIIQLLPQRVLDKTEFIKNELIKDCGCVITM